MNSIVALPIAAALPVAAPAMDFPIAPSLAPPPAPEASGETVDPVFAAIKKHKKARRALKAASTEVRRLIAQADQAVGPRSIQVLDMREPSNPPGFHPFVDVTCWIDIKNYVSPETDAELYNHYRAALSEQHNLHAKHLATIVPGGDIDTVDQNACEEDWEAVDELVATVPTSVDGIFAMLSYVGKFMNKDDRDAASLGERECRAILRSLAKAARAHSRSTTRTTVRPSSPASAE
jgi:hypothetical protein